MYLVLSLLKIRDIILIRNPTLKSQEDNKKICPMTNSLAQTPYSRCMKRNKTEVLGGERVHYEYLSN